MGTQFLFKASCVELMAASVSGCSYWVARTHLRVADCEISDDELNADDEKSHCTAAVRVHSLRKPDAGFGMGLGSNWSMQRVRSENCAPMNVESQVSVLERRP